MTKTYIFAVTFDDAELSGGSDNLATTAQDLVKRGLDFAQQGTVDAVVESFGEVRDQETDNYGQVVVYTGRDRQGFEIDFDALDDPGID